MQLQRVLSRAGQPDLDFLLGREDQWRRFIVGRLHDAGKVGRQERTDRVPADLGLATSSRPSRVEVAHGTILYGVSAACPTGQLTAAGLCPTLGQ